MLGVRPSMSSLRAAAAASRRTQTVQSRPRLTYGMPRPDPDPHRTAPARFDAARVEEWLASHPRRDWLAADQGFRSALRNPDVQVEAAVRRAREGGLTWSQITVGLQQERQDPRSRAGIFKAYRHVED